MYRLTSLTIVVSVVISSCLWSQRQLAQDASKPTGRIIVSTNRHYLQHEDGRPFFWLGDTGWLLFQKLSREEVVRYLEDRNEKGFNVIQCQVIHEMPEVDCYGDSAFVCSDPTRPALSGDPSDMKRNGYWEHVDFVIDKAQALGIYVAMVPAWGSVVRGNVFTIESAQQYARFLAERYRNKQNIFWMNGGDNRGDLKREIWEAIGSTLKKYDPDHLITFHPFGRTQSSTWFHSAGWLDFNQFQSGHRRYDQDDSPKKYGEDNWRYVQDDYGKTPPKPTLDGEPSYENIPQGLHDAAQPYWTADDARRYAYWSVFAGACGHTYGDNSVMQMYRPGDKPSYGARNYWYEALEDPGASQMRYLKNLILSRPYFERIGDQAALADTGLEKYERVLVTRGNDYLMAYTFTGSPFHLKMGRISGKTLRGWWSNPRNGEASDIGLLENTGVREFHPPGAPSHGSDWVLVLDDVRRGFSKPGTE